MRNGLLLLAAAARCGRLLRGDADFLGREGGGDGFYSVRGEPPPEPRSVPLRQAAAEPALHGVILRVAGEAPTQGFYPPSSARSAAARPTPPGS